MKSFTISFLLTVFLYPILFSHSFAQTTIDRTFHHEIKNNDYIPDLRGSLGRSPGYQYSLNSIITTQVNVDENGLNIVGDAANEPSIAFDRNNPNRIAIGWRQFNSISSDFRQAGYGYTADGGQSWTFPGVIEPGVFRSDPVLDADKNGNFFYNSLTNNPTFFCDVFKSTDGGATWGDKTYAFGGDKQWMTIDKTAGIGTGNVYSYWTSSFSVCFPEFFTRSIDDGGSYQNCVDVPNDPYWGTLAVGKDGNLYLGGTIGFDFLVAKSTTAKDPAQSVTWQTIKTVSLDGSIAFGGGPNPGGLLGQTWIAVDTSDGATSGNVYLLASVTRASNSDPCDVMFSRSTDAGNTWSAPIRINDDPGTSAFQWFGTMSVAPNGRIDVVWLDTRDNSGSTISALYYSNSNDGGLTWSPNERLSDFFNSHIGWPIQNKMGDYFDMVSDDYGSHLSWAATFNGEQDVYYSRIIDSTLVPVELVSFTAKSSSANVLLEWSTATEVNNSGFQIERSFDRLNWIPIAFVDGKGTTTERQTYQYSDLISGLNSNKLYYRLKQIDFDGTFKFSQVVEVEILPEKFALEQNYPNPFNPSTKIRFEIPGQARNDNTLVTLKVFDVLGNEVATLVNEEKPAGIYEVEFNGHSDGGQNLSSGIYFYKLQAGSFALTKKMSLLK